MRVLITINEGKMNSVVIRNGNVNFTVNYWTEILWVMFILCDDQNAIKQAGAERGNANYRKEVIDRFSIFSEHSAIKLLQKLSKEYYFNYDAPVLLFLMLSENKVCRRTVCKQRMSIERSLFRTFIDEIKDFEDKINFKSFYNEHVSFYTKCIEEFISDLSIYSPIEFLYKTLNIKSRKSLNINLMCAVTSANYGVFVNNKLYANIRPYKYSKVEGEPCFSYEPIYFTTLVLHEFAHSFVNSLVFDCVNESGVDGKKYASELKNFEYGENVGVYIAETFIRALECLYVKQVFSTNYNEYVSDYISEGFVKLEKVIQLFETQTEREGESIKLKELVNQVVSLFNN